jgi:hypothetical protein
MREVSKGKGRSSNCSGEQERRGGYEKICLIGARGESEVRSGKGGVDENWHHQQQLKF